MGDRHVGVTGVPMQIQFQRALEETLRNVEARPEFWGRGCVEPLAQRERRAVSDDARFPTLCSPVSAW